MGSVASSVSEAVSDVVSSAGDAVQSVVDAGSSVVQSVGSAVSDAAQSVSDAFAQVDPGPAIGDAGASIDKVVNDTIPGGWATVGAVAATIATAGAASETIPSAIATEGAIEGGVAASTEIAATTSTAASAAAGNTAAQAALEAAATGAAKGAAIGAAKSALTGGDVVDGALMGAVTGAVGAGVGNVASGLTQGTDLADYSKLIGTTAGGTAAGATGAAINEKDPLTGALIGGLTAATSNLASNAIPADVNPAVTSGVLSAAKAALTGGDPVLSALTGAGGSLVSQGVSQGVDAVKSGLDSLDLSKQVADTPTSTNDQLISDLGNLQGGASDAQALVSDGTNVTVAGNPETTTTTTSPSTSTNITADQAYKQAIDAGYTPEEAQKYAYGDSISNIDITGVGNTGDNVVVDTVGGNQTPTQTITTPDVTSADTSGGGSSTTGGGLNIVSSAPTTTTSPTTTTTTSAYPVQSANSGLMNLEPGLTKPLTNYSLSGLHMATGGSTTSSLFDSKGNYNYSNTGDTSLTPALTKHNISYTLTGLPGKADGGLIEGHNPQFYSEGGASLANRYVKGAGDGTSDSVPAMLANGEFVIPADVVSNLGNGSNDSGAKILNEFLRVIREHKRKADARHLPPDSKGPLSYLTDAKRKVRK